MNARCFLLVGVALLCAPAVVPATQLQPVEVACPVCDATLTAFRVTATNAARGVDRDYCAHARGTQPVFHRVWTCTACGYSARPDDFYQPLTATQQAAVRQRVALATNLSQQTNFTLPALTKYTLALACADVLDVTTRSRADLARDAAWAVRLAADEAFDKRKLACRLAQAATAVQQLAPCEQDIALAARLLDRAAERTPARAALRPVLALQAAWLLRVRGELALAADALQQVEEADTDGAYAADVEALRADMAQERRFMRQALELYNTVLVQQPDTLRPGEAATLLFLLGEFHRRCGELELALNHYAAAAEENNLPPELSRRLRQREACVQAERAGVPTPAPAALHALASSRQPAGATDSADLRDVEDLSVRIPQGVLDVLQQRRR